MMKKEKFKKKKTPMSEAIHDFARQVQEAKAREPRRPMWETYGQTTYSVKKK